jgi:diguanylate cyclase (GGDEF)-like protein
MSTNFNDTSRPVAAPPPGASLREELTSALVRERDQDVKLILTRISRLVDRRTPSARQAEALNDVIASISTLAFRDELTGLLNRRGFMRLGAQVLALSERDGRHPILFYMDVDHLKHVNDSGGHRAGDDLLVRASAALKATFRDTDVLGRLSGDEFAALTVSDGAGGERSVLNRLRRTLARANAGERRFPVSLSVGVATFDPVAPATLDELIARADGGMYVQKRARLAVPALFQTVASESRL